MKYYYLSNDFKVQMEFHVEKYLFPSKPWKNLCRFAAVFISHHCDKNIKSKYRIYLSKLLGTFGSP